MRYLPQAGWLVSLVSTSGWLAGASLCEVSTSGWLAGASSLFVQALVNGS